MNHTSLAPNALRVRMYRVGFGDCFLISFPDEGRHHHILVDCGVHAAGQVGTLGQVVENVLEECQGSLAVVVASHTHQDHISGFAEGRDLFGKIKVGQVWMPWCEDPHDRAAVRLRQKHLAIIQALSEHLLATNQKNPALLSVVQNLLGNDEALRVLRRGFRGSPEMRYLRAGERFSAPAGVAGLSVEVLGPPDDESFLSRMDLPTGERFLTPPAHGVADRHWVEPFSSTFKATRREYGKNALSPDEEKRMRKAVALDTEGLAFALDSVLNNTSLVLLLSFHGQCLLFPGDAQWGNWQAWLEADGADERLDRVTLFKVPHHGSGNATPKRALRAMTGQGLTALVSTQTKPWSSIPHVRLLDALSRQTRGRVARSDWVPVSAGPNVRRAGRLPKGFTQGEFWMDWTTTA